MADDMLPNFDLPAICRKKLTDGFDGGRPQTIVAQKANAAFFEGLFEDARTTLSACG